MKNPGSFAAVLLSLHLALSWACDPDMIPITSADLPSLNSEDTVEVFFLRAPLAEEQLKTQALGVLGLFHAGVGFRADNGTQWTFEFDADDFSSAIFPAVVNDNITWNTRSGVCFYPGIQSDYWQVALGTTLLNSSQYDELTAVLGGYGNQANNSHYNAWAIWDDSVHPPHALVRPNTCTEYVWAVFEKLKAMGVQLSPVLPPRLSQGTVFADMSQAMTMVTMEDPVEKAAILDFYKKLRAVLDDVGHRAYPRLSVDLLELRDELKKDIFYVYAGAARYFKVHFKSEDGLKVLLRSPPGLFPF